MAGIIEKAEKVQNLLQEFQFCETVEISSPNPLSLLTTSTSNPNRTPKQRYIQHFWAKDLSNEMKSFLFDLFAENMKEMYLQSSWGWNQEELWEEFYSSKSSYLLVVDPDTSVVEGYSHFQVWKRLIRFSRDSL